MVPILTQTPQPAFIGNTCKKRANILILTIYVPVKRTIVSSEYYSWVIYCFVEIEERGGPSVATPFLYP